jgi:4-hydroxybenzoate polyprenyltransferase
MIRIPTGPVPKNTARTVSLVLGVLAGVASFLAPQYSGLLREIGMVLTPLGITLGKQ